MLTCSTALTHDQFIVVGEIVDGDFQIQGRGTLSDAAGDVVV